MIVEEQTICIQCKVQYSDSNLPRLLTMCGHTFCQKCIRQLMSKRKMNNKYRLTCPIDKQTTQLSSPNPTVFPKNLSVLNLAKKKFQISSTSRRLSTISKGKSESHRSKDSKATIILQSEMLIKTCSKLRDEGIQKSTKDFIFQQGSHNTCLLHQKPLELVCVRDFQRICSSCVIFGEHRGHNVKNTSQVQETIKNKKQVFKAIQKQTKISFQKLQSKQVLKLIEGMLQRKKSQLHKEITKKFHRLKEQIIQAQKKSLVKLEKRIEDYKSQFLQNLQQKKLIREKYREWQENLNQKVDDLSSENEENRLKTALKCDSFMQVSERNLQMFKYIEQDFLEESEKKLQNLALISDQQEIRNYLKSYCKFDDCTNSFLQVNASRITQVSTMLHQQILLDDSQDNVEHPQTFKQTQKFLKDNVSNSRMRTSDQYSCMNILENASNKLNRLKSSGKQFPKDNKNFLSPHRKNSDLKLSRVMMGTERSFLHGMVRSNQIPEKYEKKLQAIINGSSDTLDLTNGQLTNEKVFAIIEYIKDYPVTIVKLVRNKLTDECLIKSIPFLNNVVMLNVSRNELTQKSIQFVLSFRKQGGLRSLKSLMIGQNKIIERKNKQILDQLRKMGINICN